MKTGVPSEKAGEYLVAELTKHPTADTRALADEAIRRYGFEPQDRPGFVKVPHGLLEDRALSPVARLVAMEIASYAFGSKTEAWPTDNTVANALGLSLSTVRRAKAELRKAERGWVRPTGHRQYNGPAIYSVAEIQAATGKT